MSAGFTASEAALWTGGRWTHPPQSSMQGALQDSRRVEPGQLYLALPGARVDGHAYIAAAFGAGAAGALCQTGQADPHVPCLEVPDPEEGLRDIVRGYRSQLSGVLIGITGSAGKTTVKDLLASMCRAAGPTASTRGNWNNAIGLPLSLLQMRKEDAYGVFELGMNQPGEIADLSALLRPDMALITSIGEAHLEQLGTTEAIAREKASLLASLSSGGTAVVDMHSPWRSLFTSECRGRIVFCGWEASADIQGRRHSSLDQVLIVRDSRRGLEVELEVPLPGKHMLQNTLHAVAAAFTLGLTADHVMQGIRDFVPAPMRWEVLEVEGRRVINDAYNANPLSMRSAISTFAESSSGKENWLVLGGMGELGEAAESLHRELGRWLARSDWSGVVGVGRGAEWIMEEISGSQVHRVQTPEDAAQILAANAGPGAWILLKGSRSEGLEQIPPLLSTLLSGE